MHILPRWIVAASVAVALPLPLIPHDAGAQSGNVVVNMRDVEIADVAQQISRITGRTIILDPAVDGTINVTSATPLSPAAVWELFVSVLRGQGYAVVRTGRAWRVVPQAAAIRQPSSARAGGQIVTRLIRLQRLSPEAAARIFGPLVADFGSIEPVTNPNAIVVTDYSDNVARIASLAQSLDRGGADTTQGFASIEVREGSATDIAAAIESIMGGEEGGPRAVADERSNIVLIRGTTAQIAEARRIVTTLDRPSGVAPVVRVIRLRYNDAETITEIVGGLVGGQATANNPVARTLSGVGSGIGSGIGDNRLVDGVNPCAKRHRPPEGCRRWAKRRRSRRRCGAIGRSATAAPPPSASPARPCRSRPPPTSTLSSSAGRRGKSPRSRPSSPSWTCAGRR